MAAVYLHNAIYARNPSEPRDALIHARNLSTISHATLLTSTTLHSQPTEPLLQPAAGGQATAAYYDQLSRQPRDPDGTPARLRWDDPLALDTTTAHVGEKGRYWRRGGRRPTSRWKWVKVVLEMVIAAWATYNTIRYFLAFTIYNDSVGQTFCLALGTSTGLSVALALCSWVLAVLKRKLFVYGLGYKYLTYIRTSLHYSSSFFLLGPAAVNFALVFLWKNSTYPPLELTQRCRIDVDVVWSVTQRQCKGSSPAWSTWLILASVRLALTLVMIIGYHAISFIHPEVPPRPTHRHRRSESFPTSPSTAGPSSSTMLVPPLGPQRQTSESTLVNDSSRQTRMRVARSRSSELSGESGSGEPISFGRSTLIDQGEYDREQNFVDRFRSLLSQITQETEEALEMARSDGAPSPDHIHETSLPRTEFPPAYSEDYDDDDDDDTDDDEEGQPRENTPQNVFNLPRIPPSLGYNEFGLPYPADQDVRMLNGYIRRMPTIESMGSGEIGSSIGASSHRPSGSTYTSSRPPTRSTLLSFSSTEYEATGSAPPSRANSLSARAELLVGLSNINGTSEHGELLGRPDLAMRRVSSPTSFFEHPAGNGSGAGDAHSMSTGTSTSRGTTMSYHTAAMGGSGDSYLPSSYPPEGLPIVPRPREQES